MTKIEIEYFITYAPSWWSGYPLCRCSIGHLTDKELDYFMENSNVLTYPDLVLEGKYRISLNTDKEKTEHFMALEQFEKDYEKFRINLEELYANGKCLGSLEQWPDELNALGYAHDMRCLQEFAEDVRVKFRPKDVSQPVVNDTTSKSISTPASKGKIKQTRNKGSKYEVAVAERLRNIVEGVKKSWVTYEDFEGFITINGIATHLKKNHEDFKETKIETIEQYVSRSKAWKGRKETLKEAYGIFFRPKPPSPKDL